MKFDPFLAWVKANGLPPPIVEYRFAPPRRWRFDYAWLLQLVALEREGGVFTGGRHTQGAGFEKDLEKYNTATLNGWRVFRLLPKQMESQGCLDLLSAVLPRSAPK